MIKVSLMSISLFHPLFPSYDTMKNLPYIWVFPPLSYLLWSPRKNYSKILLVVFCFLLSYRSNRNKWYSSPIFNIKVCSLIYWYINIILGVKYWFITIGMRLLHLLRVYFAIKYLKFHQRSLLKFHEQSPSRISYL